MLLEETGKFYHFYGLRADSMKARFCNFPKMARPCEVRRPRADDWPPFASAVRQKSEASAKRIIEQALRQQHLHVGNPSFITAGYVTQMR